MFLVYQPLVKPVIPPAHSTNNGNNFKKITQLPTRSNTGDIFLSVEG